MGPRFSERRRPGLPPCMTGVPKRSAGRRSTASWNKAVTVGLDAVAPVRAITGCIGAPTEMPCWAS